MKKTTIALLVIVLAALAIIISTVYNSSTYSSFVQAATKPEKTFNILGKPDLSKPLEYNPAINPNLFVFTAKDNEGNSCRVIYTGAKPQDFEKADQVVIIGSMKGNDFLAKEMLLKCPSKYNDKDKPVSFGDSAFSAK
jgi:cytochrome c-type biogenesis protein CcmE